MENLLGLEGDKNDSPVNYFVTFFLLVIESSNLDQNSNNTHDRKIS